MEWLPLIISAALTGTKIGMDVAGVGQPSVSLPKTTPTPASVGQTQQEKIAAITQRYPDLQMQLGGALAPETLMSMAGISAGMPGDPNTARMALERWLGLSDTGSTATAGGSGPLGTQATPSPTLPSAGPSLAMFPMEAVPAYEGLTGGST